MTSTPTMRNRRMTMDKAKREDRWTPEFRLKVINDIVVGACDKMVRVGLRPTTAQMYGILVRIEYAASMPNDFCESGADNIINGGRS